MNQSTSTSTSLVSPFRNRHVDPKDDYDDEEDKLNNSDEISLVSTFSYDSDQMSVVDNFDGNLFTIDSDNTVVDFQSQKNNKRRKITTTIQHHCDDNQNSQEVFTTIRSTTNIVTPEKSQTAYLEIGTANSSQSLCLDFSYDKDVDTNFSATTTLQSNPSMSFFQPDTRLEHNNNDKGSTINEDNTLTFREGSIGNSEVYRVLRPLLPLDESLKAILLLLLHMEWSSSSSLLSMSIDKSVVKDACEIVYQTLDPSRRILRKEAQAVKFTKEQILFGDIVDNLIEKMGSTVDFAILFQASARANNDQVVNDKIQIFFQQQQKENDIDINNRISVLQPAATPYDLSRTETVERRVTKLVTATTTAVSKRMSHDNDDDAPTIHDSCITTVDSDNYHPKISPTLLQLAVAYGSSYYNSETLSSSSSLKEEVNGKRPITKVKTMEEFVKDTSKKLQCMGTIQKEHLWNEIVKKASLESSPGI